MKNLIFYISIILLLFSCQENQEISSTNIENWGKRKAVLNSKDSLLYGKTYLPVYSQIYQLHEHKTYDLTVTVSLRNISTKDSIYILTAEYFNERGGSIRKYFNHPIFLKPLETAEIVNDELDKEGGTGGNFIFDWAVKNHKNLPLFEAVMISTTGQQGLSFSTRGVRVFDNE